MPSLSCSLHRLLYLLDPEHGQGDVYLELDVSVYHPCCLADSDPLYPHTLPSPFQRVSINNPT